MTGWGGHALLAGLALGCAGPDDPAAAAPSAAPASVVTEIHPDDRSGRRPRFISLAPPAALEGEPYRYRVSALDDGEEVHLSLLRAPEGAALEGAILKWTPEPAQAGRPQRFTLRAADGHGAEEQEWTVIPGAGPRRWRRDGARTRH
jgi:hypothetical protein